MSAVLTTRTSTASRLSWSAPSYAAASCRRCALYGALVRRWLTHAQGLIEFIIEERGGAREDQACSASKPIEFSLLPDEEVRAAVTARAVPSHASHSRSNTRVPG